MPGILSRTKKRLRIVQPRDAKAIRGMANTKTITTKEKPKARASKAPKKSDALRQVTAARLRGMVARIPKVASPANGVARVNEGS